MYEYEIETAKGNLEHLHTLFVEAIGLVDSTEAVLSRYVQSFQIFTKSSCGAVPTIRSLRSLFNLIPLDHLDYL